MLEQLLGVQPAPLASVDFQDIPHSHSSSLLHPDAMSSSSADEAGARSSAQAARPQGNASFYQLAYYQHFFDVETAQIRSRLLRALLPVVGTQKFYHEDDPQPDLYGPFWITTTLIFLLAAAGNFANYIQFILGTRATFIPSEEAGTGVNGTGTAQGDLTSQQTLDNILVWTSDFKKVSVAASVFYAWISIVPAVVYCAFVRIGAGDGAPQKTLVEIASLFGYALATLLPVCILCIPPIQLLRWISISVSFVFSSYFLIKNLGADVNNKTVFPVIAAIVVINLGIAVLTKFYFFDF